MKKIDKEDFLDVSTPVVFVVNVYDYISQKSFDSKEEFNSYDDAVKWIQNYDFISAFGENPLGISIRTSPKVCFGEIKF